jgi:hypothetical protein
VAKWLVSVSLVSDRPGVGNLNVGEQVEADNVLDALKLGAAQIERTMAATGLVRPTPPEPPAPAA